VVSGRFKIIIFKSDRTPRYSQVIKTVRSSLEKLGLNLDVEEVDVSKNPEAAVRSGVVSTPTIDIVGLNWRFIGLPTEDELMAILESVKEEERRGEEG